MDNSAKEKIKQVEKDLKKEIDEFLNVVTSEKIKIDSIIKSKK